MFLLEGAQTLQTNTVVSLLASAEVYSPNTASAFGLCLNIVSGLFSLKLDKDWITFVS